MESNESNERVGRLTTHVLDIAHGRPAAQVTIELWRINRGNSNTGDNATCDRTHVKTTYTNADGRTDEPLLQGQEFTVGIYEIIFVIGDYFAKYAEDHAALPFLDRIPVRFGVSQPTAHYHIPLLASPWAYSTYRGS